MNPAAPVTHAAPDVPERLRFLQRPQSWRPAGVTCTSIETIETHMAWVFLVGDRAWKLKKAVRFPYLDFSTPAAREHACREELRLNARLAPGIYLGLDALRWDGRTLSLVPESAASATGGVCTLDWLVRMRRLPRDRMLDVMVTRGALRPIDVDALAEVLVRFYLDAASLPPDADGYVARFAREHATNAAILSDARFGLSEAAPTLARFARALEREDGHLRARSLQRRLVDGHGDLRPEHVCLLSPPVIIDALEFDAGLRRVDPFEEIALLGVECELAGAPWIGARLAQTLACALGDAEGAALLPLYRAYRALLRARLALAHLLEPNPRRPTHWVPHARRFVDLARRELAAAYDEGHGAGTS
jgi:aminoglycoside phosphotransferase family enzyme